MILEGVNTLGEQELKDLKKDIRSILEILTNIRVDLAKNYVTKDEFNTYKQQESTNKWKLATFCVAAGGFVFGIIQWIVSLMGG